MRYLLDTNIVSDLVRNPQVKVVHYIRKIGENNVCTSIIVAAELRYGAAQERLDTAFPAARSGPCGSGSYAKRQQLRSTDDCVHDLSNPADQWVATTCSLRLKRMRLAI